MINKLKFKVHYIILFCCYIYTFPVFSQNIQVVTEEFPPYNFTENGKIVGVSTEVVRAVLDKLNLNADIAMYPWERAYHMALQQKNTLIYSIIRNKQREKIFKWVDVVAPMQACLFSLKSNENIKITSLSDIKKYSIITNRNGAIAQNLLEQGVVDNKNLRQTISMNDNFSMLLAGRVDLMASTKLALYHLIRNRGNEPGDVVKESHCFDVGNLYMAFSPNTSDELVEKFRQALSEFKKESRYQSIINKYFN